MINETYFLLPIYFNTHRFLSKKRIILGEWRITEEGSFLQRRLSGCLRDTCTTCLLLGFYLKVGRPPHSVGNTPCSCEHALPIRPSHFLNTTSIAFYASSLTLMGFWLRYLSGGSSVPFPCDAIARPQPGHSHVMSVDRNGSGPHPQTAKENNLQRKLQRKRDELMLAVHEGSSCLECYHTTLRSQQQHPIGSLERKKERDYPFPLKQSRCYDPTMKRFPWQNARSSTWGVGDKRLAGMKVTSVASIDPLK